MEINVLDKKKNSLTIEIKGEDHTLCNAIKSELWNDKDTKISAYDIKHPLVGIPRLKIESKSDPKKALIDAANRLQQSNEKFKKSFSKEIK